MLLLQQPEVKFGKGRALKDAASTAARQATIRFHLHWHKFVSKPLESGALLRTCFWREVVAEIESLAHIFDSQAKVGARGCRSQEMVGLAFAWSVQEP